MCYIKAQHKLMSYFTIAIIQYNNQILVEQQKLKDEKEDCKDEKEDRKDKKEDRKDEKEEKKEQKYEYQFYSYSHNTMGASYDYQTLKNNLAHAFAINDEIDTFNFIKTVAWYKSPDHNPKAIYHIVISEANYASIEAKLKDQKKYTWLDIDLIRKEQNDELKKEEQYEWKPNQKDVYSDLLDIINNKPFDKFLIESVANIQRARDNGNLVIFVGAGVAKNSGVPLWGELISELESSMDIEYEEKDPLIVPQLFHNERENLEYQQKIQHILKHNKVKHNPIHNAILRLNANHIVTTNYGNLFEQTIEEEAVKYSIVKKDSDLPHAKTSNLIVKMHGDFDEKNIVLKEDDYLDYEANFPLISSFVKGLFASKLVVFVGFSFTDINLKYILQRVKNILETDFQPAYLLSLDDPQKVSKQKIDYLKRKGIHTLFYYSEITQFLKDNDKYDYHFDSRNNSWGSKSLNFINFLSNYSKFSKKTSNVHIVDQLYDSLIRFSSIKIIPKEILTELHPFKLFESNKITNATECQINHRYNYHLQISNENILRFLKEYLSDIESYKNKYMYEVQGFETKVNFIFSILYANRVICIQRFNDDSPENHNRIDKLVKNTSCNCKRCQLGKWKFQNVLIELKTGEKNKDDLQSPLIKCQALFKLGKYVECFHHLKEIINKSWQEEDYVSYYCALLNIKKLKVYISHIQNWYKLNKPKQKDNLENNKWQPSTDVFDVILKEIHSINLTQTLSELPVDEIIKETLEYIKDDKCLKKIRKKTKEYSVDLVETFKKSQKSQKSNYSFSNPTYWRQLLQNIDILYNFYFLNGIFLIKTYDFSETLTYALDGLLAAHFTQDERYVYEKLNEKTVRILIEYVPTESFSELIQKYCTDDKKLILADTQKFIDNFSNLLNSSFKKNEFMFINYSKNNEFHQQQKDSLYFKDKCKRIYNNSLLILTYSDLGNLDSNMILELINKTIVYFELFEPGWNSLPSNQLEEFILQKLNYFDAKTLDYLLELYFKDSDRFSITNNFIHDIFCKIKEKKLDYLPRNNKLVIEKLIEQIQDERSNHRGDLVSAISVLDFENYEDNIRNVILDKLSSEFYPELYYTAVDNNLIEYDQKDLFNVFLNEVIGSFPLNKDGEIRNPYRYYAHRLRLLKYKFGIPKSKTNKVTKSKDCPEYLKWILNPEKYDYDKFELVWINVFDEDIILEKLIKIKPLKEKLHSLLAEAEELNEKASKIYFKYFAK